MCAALTPSGTSDRLRVLVIAEAANPEWVSVPLVGWSLANALRSECDVHIVTQVRNREAFLRAGLVEGQDFTAIDTETVARGIYRLGEALRMGEGKGWTMVTALSSRLAYPVFERKVWRQFGSQIRAGAYDIVHRVTPLTPTANSLLAAKCKAAAVPFVMGPLNGGVPWPKGFERERRAEREWLSYVRGAYKLSGARRRMLDAASAIIAGSRFTAGDMPEQHQSKVTLVPENGIDPTRFDLLGDLPPRGATRPLRGCFVGRLVPYKGPDMLIEAAAPFLRDGTLVLDIIGDGPMLAGLKAQAAQLGVDGAITFHGWVAHADVQSILGCADMLTFPSVREFGGGVVLEAMALGVVPVICDYAGPSELVDEATGIKVAMGSRADVVAGFRAALARVLSDPDMLAPMAAAARAKVKTHYTWAAKAKHIKDIYHWVLKRDGQIPRPAPLDTALWHPQET
ncbi:MAG: glycosyltransferase family 4 protein [Pseudomonadota bacterium]|nr:glycosyltransferase family 4 protein [Pseudomonadota bacterium]